MITGSNKREVYWYLMFNINHWSITFIIQSVIASFILGQAGVLQGFIMIRLAILIE